MGAYDDILNSDTSKPGPYDDILNARPSAKKSLPKRTWTGAAKEGVGNIPSSAGNFAGNFYQMIRHPLDTVGGMLDVAAGSLRNALPDSVVRGIDAIDPNPQAAQQASTSADMAHKFMVNRYGSADAIKNTIATDPVGLAADVSSVLAGGAGLAGLSSKGATVANVLQKASNLTNPLSMLKPLGRTIDVAGKIDDANALRDQRFVVDKTLRDARDAGYVFPPTAYNKDSFLEGISGQYKTQQRAADINQAITNDAARAELGLPKKTPLTDATFKVYLNQAKQPYAEVASLSPQASATLDALNQARHDKNVFWNHYAKSGDPESLLKAKQLSVTSDNLESALENYANQAGKPDLVDRLRAARVMMAKAHTIKDATRFSTGDINADLLGNAYEAGMHGIGPKLTGNLELIGKTASARRQALAMRDFASNSTTALDNAMFALGGAASGGTPQGLLAAGIPLLRNPIRNYLLSERVQNSLVPRASDYAVGLTPRFAEGLLTMPTEYLYPGIESNNALSVKR